MVTEDEMTDQDQLTIEARVARIEAAIAHAAGPAGHGVIRAAFGQVERDDWATLRRMGVPARAGDSAAIGSHRLPRPRGRAPWQDGDACLW
jgi:hypothetical protein